jgi:uncharacterized protein YjiS (DUF1127 family)
MPNHDLEFLISNYRRLGPSGYRLLRRAVTARAKALRSEYLRDLWRQLVAWYQARAAVAQLRGLDDAALKDIGLHRSGIEAAVIKESARAAPQKRRPFPEKPHLCLQRTG